MNDLRARLLQRIPFPDGPLADVLIIEPNGDEYKVRCLCKADGMTHISEVGDGDILKYLNEKYSSQAVCALVRGITLAGS